MAPPHATKFTVENIGNLAIPEPNSGCLIWEGAVDKHGYGHLSVFGRQYIAHRWYWSLLNGPLRPEQFLCHKCDTPLCINPYHMFVGDNGSNTRDKVSKRRHSFGERVPQAKLTNDKVRAILVDTRRQLDIAAEYGLSPNHVSLIQRGKVWRHLHKIDRPALTPAKEAAPQ